MEVMLCQTQAVRNSSFHVPSPRMLTLRTQAPCCEEARELNGKATLRGTEAPSLYPNRASGSSSPQSSCPS